ncbi:M78 family metallopeptidase domain-containing protein [Trueperella pyogenes]
MTLTELISLVESHGITVSWGHVYSLGTYHHPTATIWLDYALASYPRQALGVLAHEYVHALRGHDGPQSASMERCVDRQAARLLISPAEYALAERLHEGNAVGIAEELGVPVWVVVAYREVLCCESHSYRVEVFA